MDFKEILKMLGTKAVELGAPLIENALDQNVEKVLDRLHSKNPERHKHVCQALYIGLAELEPIVDETKTNLDDAAVEGFRKGIEKSANTHGVELPS